MRIFLSHSTHYKPLLREVRHHLPEHINAWIDEDRLLVGDDIAVSLQQAIAADSDFVVLFIDRRAAESVWVKKEVEWALAAEQRLGRTFILPVVLEESAWQAFQPEELRKRKFLSCLDFTEEGIRNFANGLSSQLFAWLSRDLDRAKDHEREERPDILNEADKFLQSVASEIRTIVHPYRQANPLAVDSLYERLQSLNAVTELTLDQFVALLTRLEQQSLLAGLCFDGEEIFVEEEYFSWKLQSFIDAKKRIARRAVRSIRTGDVIALDAGSTTDEIARQLGRSLKLHRLTRLRVVTNSLPAAHELMSVGSEMGLSDDTDVLQVFISEGRIRPNTLAIVGLSDGGGEKLAELLSAVGGANICFVGTNGVCHDGFTTRTGTEASTKTALLSASNRKVIVTDPSKFGLRQEEVFASLETGIEVITVREGFERPLEEYELLFSSRQTTLIYA